MQGDASKRKLPLMGRKYLRIVSLGQAFFKMLAQFPCAAYGNTYVRNGSKINDAQFLARRGIWRTSSRCHW
jgi:hypothetical protein